MKRALLTLSALAVVAGSAWAGVTREDLKKLLTAGVSDEVISAFIRANGPVDRLSADDIIELKKAGASDKLLVSLVPPKAEENKPVPQSRPQPPVQIPQVPPNFQVETPRRETEPSYYVQQPATAYVEPAVYRTYTPYPSTAYYSYPSCGSYYSWSWPSWCGSYSRYHRRSGWSIGWCW